MERHFIYISLTGKNVSVYIYFICFSGLVLQDLTFVHIGNSDLLPDGTINFSKRWQQFNIVENMKRFKKG